MQLVRSAATNVSSNTVRKKFLEYFCGEKKHRLVRSSPVLPLGDPTLAFCNAGMNQFKAVLLGTAQPPFPRVANSQKCVRVGGKHNDLAQVGTDGTHHTFFEMLGNWSFGDYFKKEACEMAWDLLATHYEIPRSQLHVTYFGGDTDLGLPPDLETRDIWRSIGVGDDQIQACGARDNLWEMGSTGPCGACTEIHYLPIGAQPKPDNLLELWNLVFIELKREADGSLHKLNRRHVDTGMGFERLVAVLQGANSNYDTDLFLPLFGVIQKASGRAEYMGRYGNQDASLDTAYRILADHARMISVCLADGFYPEQEGKLRGIMRKALTVSREVFNNEEGLLRDLSSAVAETLNDPYPEIQRNLKRVHYIIDHEAELLRALRKDRLSEWNALCRQQPELKSLSIAECPNLLLAYRKLKQILADTPATDGVLAPEIAMKLCETYGVPQNLAPELALVTDLKFDEVLLEQLVVASKLKSRKEMYGSERSLQGELSPTTVSVLTNEGVPVTDDSHKYGYLYGFTEEPSFPTQTASIVALLVDGEVLNYVSPELLMADGCRIGILLDRSNAYSEAGGQVSDCGLVTLECGTQLRIEHVNQCAGYVVHWISSPTPSKMGIRVNSQCRVNINAARRKSLMNNHTATHILNAALRQLFTIIDQKSSRVYPHKLCFDFSVYKEHPSAQDIEQIESIVRKVILHDVPVRRTTINTAAISELDVTTLPGETYHHSRLHVIQINSGYLLSREPCCGSHALQTSHLEDFVVTNYKSISSCVKSLEAVTGAQAAQARHNTSLLAQQLAHMQLSVNQIPSTPTHSEVEHCDEQLVQLSRCLTETELLSYVHAQALSVQVSNLRERLKYLARGTLRMSMEDEMRSVVSNNSLPFIVHKLECSSKLDSMPLAKVSRICSKLPSFIFSGVDGVWKARCYVPQEMVQENFSAKIWMDHVMMVTGGECGAPRGQPEALVCNMKARRLSGAQVLQAVQSATEFAYQIFCE